ncbi:toprim domain-containing protein [Rhodospirillum sp. A1_3_36]|uniref:DUF7146 domain-containing protein n=1 Tax=Rhodospirillum sp. A1_3_36 TaxID=3391666 RepID=UPI0039A501B6
MDRLHPFAEVARTLGQNAEAVCRAYLPKGRLQGRYWTCGDVMGTPGRSLYVRLFDPRPGRWTDAASGEYGDLLDLIARNRGLGAREALEEARAFLRLPSVPVSPLGQARVRERESPGLGEAVKAACRLFAASRPIRGTLAEWYLRGRGILLPPDLRALRFHPHCHVRTPSGCQDWPALIAAVTGLDGAITGLHRTYLDPRGGGGGASGKAPLETPRKSRGRLLGQAVRFGRARDVLLAGEGIETVLSVRSVLPTLPMVAALSAGHLAALLVPGRVRRLYVAQDNDPPGRRAAGRLVDRAKATGIEARPLSPRFGDFNDDLRLLGPGVLYAGLLGQLAPEDREPLPPAWGEGA